jgi:ADP-heptose:LPS heptosyltransferase
LPYDRHHVDQFLQLARRAGATSQDRRLSFHLTAAARDAALAFIREQDLEEERLRIAIHPGASKESRAWHAERFGEVAAALVRDLGVRPILLGGAGDHRCLATIQECTQAHCVLPPPGLGLQEMSALLEHCNLLLCNDSGPMHIAAALRIPVVAIFGPGTPERTAPLTDPDLARILSRSFPCSPCRQDFFRECSPSPSRKPWCLEEMTVAEVVSACRDLLKKQDPGETVEHGTK